MNAIKAIMWKEKCSFVRDKKVMANAILFPLLYPVLFLFTDLASILSGEFNLFSSSGMVVAVATYIFTWKSFSHERTEKALTSLLASPVTVSEFFLGKVLAAFIFSYAMLLLSLPIVLVGLADEAGGIPPLSTFVLALVTIPIWGLVVIQIMGAVYLLIGNVEMVRFLGLLVMISIINVALTDKEVIADPIVIAIATASAIAAATIILVLFGKVSKPRLAK